MKKKQLIYISQGNIPSKWAHTFQAMKMAEALSQQVNSFTLLTSGSLLPSKINQCNLMEWYGLTKEFSVIKIPTYLSLKADFFENVRNRRFDRFAALYAKFKHPDLVYTRSEYAGYLCVNQGVPTIIETHITTSNSNFQQVISISKSDYFKGIVTVNDYLKEQYIQKGISENKIFVFPDGVDLKQFQNLPSQEILREQLNLPHNQKIVIYAGHLYEHKGISYFIEAAKYCPELLFLVVGGWDKDIRKCQEQSQKLGLSNLQFTGFVAHEKIPQYLSASDLLILPNSGNYEQAYTTSPLKLFEYMAARRPIIATNIPALQGLLKDKHNAFLVQPDSSEAIAKGVRALIYNPDLSANIVKAASKQVQQFTWSHRAESILDYFINQR